jgi:ribosome maturation factor RimP
LTWETVVAKFTLNAGIAQLVECKLPKLDVAGSNPVARSREWLSPPGCRIPGFLLWIHGTGFLRLREVSQRPCAMDRVHISSLWSLIEPVLEPEGIELVELEFKLETGRWVLRLYIDRPDGVNLDDCELVSRQIGALLDVQDPIRQPYNLEVSSPGINRVLRREKDFQHYAGTPVRIRTRKKMNGRRNFQGILRGMEDSRVILDVEGTRVAIDPEAIERAQLNLPDADLFRGDLRKRAISAGD